MTQYTLVPLDGGDIGVLFRIGTGVPSPIHFLRTDAEGEVLAGPVVVGETAPFAHSGNLQPIAARIDRRICFVDPARQPDECAVLRWTGTDRRPKRRASYSTPPSISTTSWSEPPAPTTRASSSDGPMSGPTRLAPMRAG
jgi:hypothetical protein